MQSLEHTVLGPGNFAQNFAALHHIDSVAEIQAKRTASKQMQDQWFYAGLAAAYSTRNNRHIMELYDLNDSQLFPDKASFVNNVRGSESYTMQIPDQDRKQAINLSDEKFNRFVTRDNDQYSHVSFQLSDIAFYASNITKGRKRFKRIYGAEAEKLFTTLHGKDIYSKEGIEGKFSTHHTETNVYFLNKDYTEKQIPKGVGAKLMRAAFLCGLVDGSCVDLDVRFDDGDALVSGVVQRPGEAGEKTKETVYTNEGIITHLDSHPITDVTFAKDLLSRVNKFYQNQEKK